MAHIYWARDEAEPAACNVVQQTTTPGGAGMTVAAVQVRSVGTADGRARLVASSFRAISALPGPTLETVTEELTSAGWQVTNAIAQAISYYGACRHLSEKALG